MNPKANRHSGVTAMPVIETAVGTKAEAGSAMPRGGTMEGTQLFLEFILKQGWAKGHLRGVFHIAIGRKVRTEEGHLVAGGSTWRELAAALKAVKFDKSLVKELGADPEALSVRDREKFWYAAIALSGVGSSEALAQAERLATKLERSGWYVDGFTAPVAEARKPKKK
jgi:hypothetical protein